MKYRNWLILSALAVATAAPLSGCGDNDNHEVFSDCGDGVVNDGEECDDGNSAETDACLSTCEDAGCGDGFIQTGVEACDGSNLNGASCESLGEGSGTLRCGSSCDFDTSGCGGGPVPTFTPTPTPGNVTPTPTVEPSGGDPTPTPTSTTGGGPTCGSGETVVVDLTLSLAVGGVQLQLGYPASARIPGTLSDQTVVDAVDFPPGLPSVNDEDTNGDQVDDRLSLAWVTSGSAVSGTFATVTFDCVEGQTAPSAGDLNCVVTSASDELGTDLQGVTCTPTIQ